MTLKAEVHVRRQHSKQSRRFRGFGGPDTYVAVTVALEGDVVPKYLNRDVLRKRGIMIKYFGEGYRQHHGPRSALGKAIAAATKYTNQINGTEVSTWIA